MPRAERLVTAEELLHLPDDGYRYELVEGRLIKMSPPGARHGIVALQVAHLLKEHVDPRRLGIVMIEAGVVLVRNPDTVRGPDVAFFRRDRIPTAGIPEGYWPGPPDLVVEVRSPGDRAAEFRAKVKDYLARGVRLVWIVDAKKSTVTIYKPFSSTVTLGKADTIDAGDVVPGFTCPVSRIFEQT